MNINTKFKFLYVFIITICIKNISYSQTTDLKTFVLKDSSFFRTEVHEKDKVIKKNITGMSNRNITCDEADVRVFPSANPQSEVHISLNKINSTTILVSSQTNFGLGNSLQGHYFSQNNGINWNGSDVLPNNGFGRGDPSTAFDAIGRGYIESMSPNSIDPPDGYFIQRTDNNGLTWQPQVRGVGPIADFDKPMITADDIPTSPFANNLYCAWSILPDPSVSNLDFVQFNRSTNGGQNFSNPTSLKNGVGQGTNIQTGPNGEVYICWADYLSAVNLPARGLGFSRSLDGGNTFTSYGSSIWKLAYNYVGIRTVTEGNPNYGNTRVNDFPSMAVDKSNRIRRGRIYTVYATQENGNGRGIIELRFSDNQGDSWSAPTVISIQAGRQSWFPWITVDNTNGDIYITYYCFDTPNGTETNTYVAYSENGGQTFTNQIASDVRHNTAPIPGFRRGYAGDYIGITAGNNRAYAAWADNRTGVWQIYVSRVTNYSIGGDMAVCNTSNNYSITNLPAGAAVVWNVTPAIVRVNCPTCQQTTLTYLNQGTFTLTAQITNACGTVITVTRENILSGTPPISSTYTYNGTQQPIHLWDGQYYNPLCSGVTSTIIADIQGASSTLWSKVTSTPEAIPWTQLTSNSMQFNFWNFNQTAIFKVDASNGCGTTTQQYAFQSISCGGPACKVFTISPNPAKSFFRIIKPHIPLCRIGIFDNGIIKNAAYFIQSVKIYDRVGNIKSQTRFTPNSRQQADINTSMLKTGIYFVDISDGKTTERHQLVITQ